MTEERENLKLVIVGHIDHGKSTLMGRLFYDTGCLPDEKFEEIRKVSEQLGRKIEFAHVMDHLKEEREQGITIDTAQSFFKTEKRDYVIVDTPGHREFTKNMMTGASQAEVAMLIVDVASGVEEQTRRHAYILGMLGMKQVVILANKMDLVSYEEEPFRRVTEEASDFLSGLGIRASRSIPMSAYAGDNVAKRSGHMPWYDGKTVLEALDEFQIPRRSSEKSLRMCIQDIYEIDGKHLIVGRVETGRLKVGQSIKFMPSGIQSTVTSVEFFGGNKRSAEAGECPGITLADELSVRRGLVACEPDSLPAVTDRFRANIFWLSPEPWERDQPLVFKCATQEVQVRAETIVRSIDSSTLATIAENASELREHEVGEAVLKASAPVVLESFGDVPELGRFVLVRDYDVVAGGIVTHVVGGRS